MSRNDNAWQGVLLGLGDDGVTYHCQGDTWQPCIPKLAHKEIELAEANTVSATLLTTKCRELAEVTKQRDLLIEGLEKLASCDWVITLPDRMDAVRNIARETLNKLKP